jgi:hypothetical protein
MLEYGWAECSEAPVFVGFWFGLGGMSMLGGGYTFSHLRLLCVFAAVLQAIGG